MNTQKGNAIVLGVVGVIAVVSLIFGAIAVNRHMPEARVGAVGQSGQKGERGAQGPMGPQGPRGFAGADGTNNANLGSIVSTLDSVDSPFVSIAGSRYYYYNQAMSATSSTVCSLKNPFNATSTVMWYSINIKSNGIASAQAADISTSSTAVGSSTPAFVKNLVIGAGLQSTIWQANATTTNSNIIGISTMLAGGVSDIFLSPTDTITFKIATGTPGTFSAYYGGTCKGLIRIL